jgi:hypothetical protein
MMGIAPGRETPRKPEMNAQLNLMDIITTELLMGIDITCLWVTNTLHNPLIAEDETSSATPWAHLKVRFPR